MPKAFIYLTSTAAAMFMAGSLAAQELPDLSDWHEASQAAAQDMVEKYGQPDGVTDTMLVWNDNGPWKRTVIYKEAVQHAFPTPHPDVLEQVIDYDVAVDMYDELAEYDGSVIVERTAATMAARCDKEAANFLALNLAHDILTGERTVHEARTFYADTMEAVMGGGEPENPEYIEGFTFDVPQEDLTNPDEAIFEKS